MDRQKLRDRARRFDDHGLERLINSKPPGRRSRFSPEQKEELCALLCGRELPHWGGVMLQANRLLTAAAAINSTPSEILSSAELITSFRRFVHRQFPIILFVFLLTIGLSILYILTTPPLFTAQASMIIDTRKVQIFEKQALLGENSIDTGMVDSEVEILRSENVSLAVIKRFHLEKDPEFVGPAGGLLGAPIGMVSNVFGPDTPKSEFELLRRAAAVFAQRLTVKRTGFSYIIQISFQSRNPQRAADIANAIAEAYIVDQLEAKYQASRRAGVWLQDRLRELSEQASTGERAVVEFKAQNNIVNTGGSDKRLVDEQQVAELNSQLVIARAQVSESRARLDRIQAVLQGDSPNTTVDATVTDTLKNDVITKLRERYIELAARENDWSSRYGKNHFGVINLRNQMSEIRNAIIDELRRIGETYKSDYEISKQREEGIEKELAQAVSQSQVTNRAKVTLTELESNAQSYRRLYDDFLQRYMESIQQQSFPITEARVVTRAVRPLTKSYPRTLLVLLISAAGGLVLGLGIGRVRDLSDRVFRTRAQVEATLGLDCLTIVPYIKLAKSKGATSPGKNGQNAAKPTPTDNAKELISSLAQEAVGGSSGPRTIAPRHDLLWQVVENPLSPFAETIRSIKMAADLFGASKSNKILGITSILPNEGKTTIAASLAQLSSHSGRRVILVDCDLRAPQLTRSLAPDAKAGFLEVASGRASLDEVIWTDRSTNLSFLPSVAKPRLLHAAEILGADGTKAMFDGLRKTHDYIIVDLSPLVPIIDVRATNGLVDLYIVVIEWGRTKIELVERALTEATGIYNNTLGVVLNKADNNALSRYEGYGGYYHDKYYRQYGYES